VLAEMKGARREVRVRKRQETKKIFRGLVRFESEFGTGHM
jgi:hypothetical protein